MKRVFATLSIAISLAGIFAVAIACDQKTGCAACNFAAGSNNQQNSGGGNNGNGNVPANGFVITTLTPIVGQLGTTRSVLMSIQSGSNFTGTVQFFVSDSTIVAMDRANAIAFSFSPNTMNLTPNQTATFFLTVNIGSMAPDFAETYFTVLAKDTSGSGYATQTVGSLQVKAIYEIDLNGGVPPEKYSGSPTINFVNHSGGITINFVNYDTASQHAIHSTGPIPTQNPSMPLSPAVGNNPGGTYSYIVPDQAPVSDQYYCLLHETGANARTLNFNVPVGGPAPTPGPTP